MTISDFIIFKEKVVELH